MSLAIPKRARKSPAHARSPHQEKRIAKTLGGKVTKASGAGAFEKGDVRVKGVARIEAKTTDAKSFRVTEEMIDKIEDAAVQAGEVPVMVIDICGGNRSLCVMPTWALEDLINGLAEKHK